MIAPLPHPRATESTISVAIVREKGVLPSDAGLRANPAERPMEAGAVSSLAGANPWRSALGAFVIHAVILFLLLFEVRLEPPIIPTAQEIPVEIVVEPPPPEKPQEPAANPETPPPAPPVDLEPATDAPRAANDEKVERQAPDEATKAPGEPTKAEAPSLSPAPAEEAAGPKQENEPAAAEKSAEPVVADAEEETKAADADRPAPAQQASADANPQPDKAPALLGAPFPTWSTGAKFATSDYLPGVELGSAAEPAPVSGGKAKSTYLSILYGMIMKRVRQIPPAGASVPRRDGAIVFTVDAMGGFIQRRIARASGSRELDEAALAAVGEAAPFPAPPQGMPIQLRFTYGAK
jgi:protein TonB